MAIAGYFNQPICPKGADYNNLGTGSGEPQSIRTEVLWNSKICKRHEDFQVWCF